MIGFVQQIRFLERTAPAELDAIIERIRRELPGSPQRPSDAST
jgi:hypothetical protein